MILDDQNLPGWAQRSGNWGGTRPRTPGPDGDSPPGPIGHGQWKKPELLAEHAITHEKRPLGKALTETIVVDSLARGLIVTRDILDPQHSYAIDVSTISATSVPTGPAEKPLWIGPVRPVSPLRPVALVLRWRDKLVLWLSSTLARRVPRSPAVSADASRSDDGRTK